MGDRGEGGEEVLGFLVGSGDGIDSDFLFREEGAEEDKEEDEEEEEEEEEDKEEGEEEEDRQGEEKDDTFDFFGLPPSENEVSSSLFLFLSPRNPDIPRERRVSTGRWK